MKKVLAACALACALTLPASAQNDTTTPGGLLAGVRPVSYAITVEPNAQALSFTGDVDITIEVTAPTREIILNAANIEFGAVRLDQRTRATVAVDNEAQTARLSFARPVSAGRHVLSIGYTGQIQQQSYGLFAVDYTATGGAPERMLATQFEAADARRFVPSFDEPGLKAVFELRVIVPENRTAISNMPEAGVERLANGRKRVRFQPSPIMSSYLLFLAVGDFERITTNVNGVEIGVVTKRGDSERGRFALQAAADVIPYFNDYFGTPYPLPKLDMLAVPGAGGFGAMENWGAILYFERALLIDPAITSEGRRQGVFGTVAHEIAHQWFGNLVTMAWWDDLWLNEGFASWMAAKAAENFHPNWNAWMQAQGRRQGAMNQDSRVTTHAIVQPIRTVAEASEAFDNITYRKGAAVIRMLEEFVGNDAFRAGVRNYVAEHAYANARTADLWDAIEQASGQPMRQIAEDFTFQPGVPLISVEAGACINRRRTLTLRQTRYGLDEASRAPLRWRVPVSAQALDGGAVVSAITDDNGQATLAMPNCGGFVVNADQVGYYRVVYARAQFDQLARGFANLAPADQLGLIYDAQALGQAGLSPYSDVFDLARRTPVNADPLVWDLLAVRLQATAGLYAGLPGQQRYRDFAGGLLSPVLARTGWDPRAGEPDNAGILRAALIETLAGLGDEAVIAEARRRFTSGEMPGGIRQIVLNAVGHNADAATFDALLAQARQTTGTLERDSFQQAAMSVADPALAARALALTLSDEVPVTRTTGYIGIVADAHPELAWTFTRTHWDAIGPRLDSLSRSNYPPGLVGSSVQDSTLRDLRAYIDQNVPAEVRRGAEEDYLRLEERLATRRQRIPELDTWLNGPGRRSAERTPGRG